jgi:hypothetical protein
MTLLEYLHKRQELDLFEVNHPELMARVERIKAEVVKANPGALVVKLWEKLIEAAREEEALSASGSPQS